jgi:hypothetical protein
MSVSFSKEFSKSPNNGGGGGFVKFMEIDKYVVKDTYADLSKKAAEVGEYNRK